MKFRYRLMLYAVLLVLAIAWLVSLAPPPEAAPELRTACFQMDAAVAKLQIDANQLAASGQLDSALDLQALIAKARAEQMQDHCPGF